MSDKAIIAIAVADPAGIGPEISLKAALDPRSMQSADGRRRRRAGAARGGLPHRHRSARGRASRGRRLVGRASQRARLRAAGLGRARPWRHQRRERPPTLAFARTAIKAALAGEADAVVAAPQNETSIALAGIKFDGYPSFVARETGTDEDDVYLMLCFDDVKIVHATLHRSVRQAIEMITQDRIARVITAADRTLRRMGTAAPKMAVGGLNPHAGEDGLFGREDIEIIKPAIEAAAARGLAVSGPFGADTLFHRRGVDAFIVMLHDQGHIAAKLWARNGVAALTIGSPILFSSVAHGSAHDIAGKGVASAAAMIEALLLMTNVNHSGA